MSQLKLWDTNGNLIDLIAYGLYGLRLIIPSPSYTFTRESIPGRLGMVPLGKDLQPRNLIAVFRMESKDYDDSLLHRDKLFKLFGQGNTIYIGEEKQPDKRWLVECTEQWTPERINPRTMTTEIPLSSERGLAESVKNTLDPTMFAAQLSGYPEKSYRHNTTGFSIFNGGDVSVNPRYMDLLISYTGASSNLKIKNVTTGEEWAYTGASNAGDTIILNGVRSTKNGLSIFRDTNKKLLTIAPGWNEFELSGTSGEFEISFDFNFYTL